MTKLYAVVGALILSVLTWAHYTGWTPTEDRKSVV